MKHFTLTSTHLIHLKAEENRRDVYTNVKSLLERFTLEQLEDLLIMDDNVSDLLRATFYGNECTVTLDE